MRYTQGNLLDAEVEALVNTVNTVGIMGKGIALMFKEAFPENFRLYAAACKRKEVRLGEMFVTERPALQGPRWIINFPTKGHWRNRTQVEWVRDGLLDLRRVIESRRIRSNRRSTSRLRQRWARLGGRSADDRGRARRAWLDGRVAREPGRGSCGSSTTACWSWPWIAWRRPHCARTCCPPGSSSARYGAVLDQAVESPVSKPSAKMSASSSGLRSRAGSQPGLAPSPA